MHFREANRITPDFATPVRKMPINEIKFDIENYPNELNNKEVEYIVKDFHLEGWEPIFIDPNGYLTDGQHRLTAAKRMGLKYIDVVIIDEEMAK